MAADLRLGAVTLRRGNDTYGMLRSIRVFANGQKVAALKPNTQQTLQLPLGEHVFTAKMDWTSSAPLVVEVNADGPAIVEVALPAKVFATFVRPREAIETHLA